MGSGENEQGLRKIMDLTRAISIILFCMHCYFYCYCAIQLWSLSNLLIDRVLIVLAKTNLFSSIYLNKIWISGFLLVSLLGTRARKDEKVNLSSSILYMFYGGVVFVFSHFIFYLPEIPFDKCSALYFLLSACGYLMILSGGTAVSKYVKFNLAKDVFNKDNETFPQEERLIENEFSVNIPAQYHLKGSVRKSFINIINPFRGLLIIGTPGAGKSYFVVRHVIKQHLEKGFTMFIYDFKFPDLSLIAYNTLLKCQHRFENPPRFYAIDFDEIRHRCNPLDAASMTDISDANEAANTFMLALNKEWIKKQGDFFVESPINFFAGIIWFLKKYEDGKYCTLPHVIEFMQLEYPTMFELLTSEPEVEALISPFQSAYKHEVWEQLEGQIASAKISMARIVSPKLYYVLSGNDLSLDINNPKSPKVVCIGNSPQKRKVYGAIASLYIARITRLVNKKNKLKCSLIIDEFATAYADNIDVLIATGRSNLIAPTLAIQDYSQLKKEYGRDQAEVIMNLSSNIISGQALGETAKILSDRFGKIIQQRESISVNQNDTSFSRSTQLDVAIPPARISSLSSGEFVGMITDNPDEKIPQKIFHCEILNDHEAIRNEENGYVPIPKIRKVDDSDIQSNYYKIKNDILEIVSKRSS